MAWSSHEPQKVQELPREQLLRKESNWFSAAKELDTWKKDLREVWYELYGEYVIDEDQTLYRFELDEEKRPLLQVNSPHWVNVVLSVKENAKRGELGYKDPKTGLTMSAPKK